MKINLQMVAKAFKAKTSSQPVGRQCKNCVNWKDGVCEVWAEDRPETDTCRDHEYLREEIDGYAQRERESARKFIYA